jgi:four helix bundle protein
MGQTFKNYQFEDLRVWKISMEIVHEVYQITKRFPKTETFALSDQLQRASTSITLNIAEGSGQPTKKAFILYLQRAKSSTLECVACVKIALQEKFVDNESVAKLNLKLQEEYFTLIALIKSLNK